MKMAGAALVAIWLALNAGATLRVLRAGSCARERRVPLVVLIWAVPFVGAVAALRMLSRKHLAPQPEASSETMAIDVLAAGPMDSGTPHDDGAPTPPR
jgi:hypothetical protein